jgi:hypothetical protein
MRSWQRAHDAALPDTIVAFEVTGSLVISNDEQAKHGLRLIRWLRGSWRRIGRASVRVWAYAAVVEGRHVYVARDVRRVRLPLLSLKCCSLGFP